VSPGRDITLEQVGPDTHVTLVANAFPRDALIVWESSDDSIASVDSFGNVIVHSASPVTITAHYTKNGMTFAAKCVINPEEGD
jgi:uncharacterized protein YjdB